MMPSNTKGIYVSPDAIISSPDYFKKLIKKAGVSFFVIRSGFSPEKEAGQLLKAVDMVRQEHCHVCILAGTWWGEKMVTETPSIYKSHESLYPTALPGNSYDEVIAESFEKLCRAASPDSLCLTHARYRHPAFIEDLTTIPENSSYLYRMRQAGLNSDELKHYWRIVKGKLQTCDFAKLLSMTEGMDTANRGLEYFLEQLTGNAMFTDYINFRCHSIESSVSVFRDTVKRCCSTVLFGCNAFAPTFSRLCGQDYNTLAEICDFIQPLLGYMEWHILEPLAAWTQFFKRYANLKDSEAFRLTLTVFSLDGFPGTPLISYESKTGKYGEGEPDQIRYTVTSQLKLIESINTHCELLPVLRGNDWDIETTEFLYNFCQSLNFTTILFQGTRFLLPHTEIQQTGWN